MSETERPTAVQEAPVPPPPETAEPNPGTAGRRVATWIGLLALAMSALVGGNVFGARESLFPAERREAKAPAVSRVAEGPAGPVAPRTTLVRSQPWWQDVATLDGTGTGPTTGVTIDDGSLQWRVRATCGSGRIVVSLPDRPQPLLEADCTGGETDFGYSTTAGATTLQVAVDGPWRLQVEQQVDVPLEEPPLPSMSAPGTTAVRTGSFYRMDQTGQGTATFYRLADGSHTLRLDDDFFVSANVDLLVTLSPLEAPRTTPEFMAAPWVVAAPLDITAGSLNFTLPPGVDPTAYKSVVIWCPLIDSAYAAATLTAPA